MIHKACFLTGDNYKMLVNDTPASKKKVVALAIAMLLPTLIWIFNGFMLAFLVLKAPVGWAIITAIACGTIVFIIEKLVIMANGNAWLSLFRICIGLIIALIGSLAIDEVVFKADIDGSVYEIKEDHINRARRNANAQFKMLKNYNATEKKIAEATLKYDVAESSTLAEADGSKGTRTKGVGDITKLKDKKASERKAELNLLLDEKKQQDIMLDGLTDTAAAHAADNFNEHALLVRGKALFRLVSKDSYMLSTYILFSLLMFFFEFLVVILKHTWKKTNYERKMEMIEQIGRNRMEFLSGNKSPLLDAGNYLKQLEPARQITRRNHSIFN